MTFEDAFKTQLANILVSDDTRPKDQSDQFCAISGERYRHGDEMLFVMIPDPDGDDHHWRLVTAKREVLESMNLLYADNQAGSVPRVAVV